MFTLLLLMNFIGLIHMQAHLCKSKSLKQSRKANIFNFNVTKKNLLHNKYFNAIKKNIVRINAKMTKNAYGNKNKNQVIIFRII